MLIQSNGHEKGWRSNRDYVSTCRSFPVTSDIPFSLAAMAPDAGKLFRVRNCVLIATFLWRGKESDLISKWTRVLKDSGLLVGICLLCTVLDPLVLDAGGTPRAAIDGNPLPQAPDITANFTAEYVLPLGDGREFFVFTDWSITGDINLFLYESAEFSSSGNFEGGIDFNNNTGYVNEPRVLGIEFGTSF